MQVKQAIILVDSVTNGLWAFMWFVCFCYASDQLRQQNNAGRLPRGAIANCARSIVAFSFFNIVLWVRLILSCLTHTHTHTLSAHIIHAPISVKTNLLI